jgi:hypothetical protein
MSETSSQPASLAPACLVIADETPEFPAALTYASRLAKGAGWRLIMLRIVEPPDPAPWVSVSEEIRRQGAAAAESLTQRFAAEIWAETGVATEIIIREGDLKPELKKLLEEQPSIHLLVLASGHGAGGPGPLVTALGKSHGLGTRPVPVLVLPGALSKQDVRALDLPVGAAPETPPAS